MSSAIHFSGISFLQVTLQTIEPSTGDDLLTDHNVANRSLSIEREPGGRGFDVRIFAARRRVASRNFSRAPF